MGGGGTGGGWLLATLCRCTAVESCPSRAMLRQTPAPHAVALSIATVPTSRLLARWSFASGQRAVNEHPGKRKALVSLALEHGAWLHTQNLSPCFTGLCLILRFKDCSITACLSVCLSLCLCLRPRHFVAWCSFCGVDKSTTKRVMGACVTGGPEGFGEIYHAA